MTSKLIVLDKLATEKSSCVAMHRETAMHFIACIDAAFSIIHQH